MKLISKIFLTTSLLFVNASILLASEEAHEAVHGNPSPDHFLIYKCINFIILIVALFALIKKPIREFFAQRSVLMKQSVGQSKEFYEKAMAESKAIEQKLARLDEECKEILNSIKQSGEEESKKIVQQAHEFSEKINKDARKMVQGEISKANEELKELTIKHIQELANEYIQKELNTQDEDKLVNKFLDRLQVI